MGRNMLIAMGLLVAVSCGLREIGGQASDVNDDIWERPGTEIKPENPGVTDRTIWYVTGLDYPQGYDWMSDPEAGSVKCSLVVYANAVPMLKVPVGKEFQIAADPDMHRMMAGDLYTDYSTDSLTVIKKNGKLLFSYPGREMIIGMHMDSTGVYTLGMSRSGTGFTYRRDGELLYRHFAGKVLGGFLSSGHAFAFAEKILGIGTEVERYYLYNEGEVSQIGLRDDVTRIWDVAICDGKVHYLASLKGVSYPVLVTEDSMNMLDFPYGAVSWSCRFLEGSEEIIIEGIYETLTGIVASRLWRNGIVDMTYPIGMTMWAPYIDDGGVSCMLINQMTDEQKICRSGEIYDMPEGYIVMGTSPLAMVDGILHVGMTSIDGGSPAVWQDGDIRKLGFNGYISSISVWNP